MCTVLLAWKVVDGWPLVAGNNRDEFFSRRALPPRVYRDPAGGGRRWLASYDRDGGGSWWGWNNRDLLLWLTNRWTGDGAGEAGCRSRGRLVLDLLAAENAAQARRILEKCCETYRFNPFNLMVAGPDRLFLATNFPELRFVELKPGFHFLGNGRLVDAPTLKARSARRRLAGLEREAPFGGGSGRDRVLAVFRRALATPLPQDAIPPQGFNVRFAGYGTTASLLLARPEPAAGEPILHYCDGNPLARLYRDYSGLAVLL